MEIKSVDILLKSGKKFTFRRDSVYTSFYNKKTRETGSIDLVDYLNNSKFIKISEAEEHYFNTSEIVYIKVYEKKKNKK